jgi:hypothetical protein
VCLRADPSRRNRHWCAGRPASTFEIGRLLTGARAPQYSTVARLCTWIRSPAHWSGGQTTANRVIAVERANFDKIHLIAWPSLCRCWSARAHAFPIGKLVFPSHLSFPLPHRQPEECAAGVLTAAAPYGISRANGNACMGDMRRGYSPDQKSGAAAGTRRLRAVGANIVLPSTLRFSVCTTIDALP